MTDGQTDRQTDGQKSLLMILIPPTKHQLFVDLLKAFTEKGTEELDIHDECGERVLNLDVIIQAAPSLLQVHNN